MQFMRLPHQIFQYRLPAGALAAYLALAKYARKTSGGSLCCTVSLHRMATLLGCSRDTVRRAVSCLRAHGLVKLIPHYDPDGLRVTNRYLLASLPGRFTQVPADIFSCRLSKQQLAVYLYLLSKQTGVRQEAFPSLSEMSGILCLSKRSVVDAVRALESKGLVRKKNYRKKDGSFGRNRHRAVLPKLHHQLPRLARPFPKKGKWAAPTHRTAHTASCRTSHCIIILTHLPAYVKSFFRSCRIFLQRGGTLLPHRSRPTGVRGIRSSRKEEEKGQCSGSSKEERPLLCRQGMNLALFSLAARRKIFSLAVLFSSAALSCAICTKNAVRILRRPQRVSPCESPWDMG